MRVVTSLTFEMYLAAGIVLLITRYTYFTVTRVTYLPCLLCTRVYSLGNINIINAIIFDDYGKP